MTTKHISGPWTVELDTYPIMVCSQTETWPLVDELGNEEGCAGVFIANTGDNAANARLIAAAPDLLEALKRVMPFIDCIAAVTREEIIEYEAAMKMADAAIKKATGQE